MPKQKNKNVPDINFHTSHLAIRAADDGLPATYDDKTRSVEVVAASENPTPEPDFQRWEMIPTVLRMDGLVMPPDRRLPLLDTHARSSTSTVIGSVRELRIEGEKLVGRMVFSTVEAANDPRTNVREGHLTDVSIGRERNEESTFIEKGDSKIISGTRYDGPVNVVTQWRPRELSLLPVGADVMAKIRAEYTGPLSNKTSQDLASQTKQKEDQSMPEPKDDKLTDDKTRSASPPLAATAPVDTPPQAAPVAPVADEDKIRAAIQGDRLRAAEIGALCDQHDLPDTIRAELLGDGTDTNLGQSIEVAHERALKYMADNSPRTGFAPATTLVADERDKFRNAAEHSLILRGGMLVEKPAPGSIELQHFTLRELCKESLRMCNLSLRGTPLEYVGRALTTSDLPAILSNVANKSVLTGFETAEETWRQWASVGSFNDFKQFTLARASETQDLDEIGEDDEYKYDKISDKKEQATGLTFGKIMRLSRHSIINDDLGQLTDIPRKHGEAAMRKLGDLIYTVLTANGLMGDAVALFAAGHSNVGTAGIISEVTAAEGIKLMKQQKDIADVRRLNITPIFYIAPVAVEGASEIFFNSNQFAGADAKTTRNNPYAGSRFTRVYEPRLDDSSEDIWYMAGARGKTVEIRFLNGVQTPFMEIKQGWTIDGVEWKVRIDAVALALDWVGLVRNDPTP